MRPPTIDNYLRVVYEAGEEVGLEMVTTGLVAKRLNVAQSTATVAIQRLAREGMLSYEAYYGAKLTNAGRKRAQQTVRKHRILESFLTRVLNLNWAETHAQAQFLEQGVCPWLLERIDEFLDHPSHCPHGDPIPQLDGSLPASETMALTECREGVGFVLCRVLGHNPNLLRYLNEMRLGIGAKGVVLANASEGGPMVVCLSGQRREICRQVACKLMIQSIDTASEIKQCAHLKKAKKTRKAGKQVAL
ncbi:MAG TPA: metal-dependent transcriptional regulator [Thermoguttaceae bacterium]